MLENSAKAVAEQEEKGYLLRTEGPTAGKHETCQQETNYS